MGKGFRMVIERLDGRETTLAEACRVISDTLLDEIGGSMGPLYGSFFLEVGDVIKDRDPLDAGTLARALRAGEDAVADLGEGQGRRQDADRRAHGRRARRSSARTGRGAISPPASAP